MALWAVMMAAQRSGGGAPDNGRNIAAALFLLVGSSAMRQGLIILCGAACLLLGGCSTSPSQPLYEAAPPPRSGLGLFEVVDATARNALSCTGLIQHALKDGRLEIVCNVKSRESLPKLVQVQCVWAEEGFSTMAEQSNWREFSLPPRATETLRFTSSRPGLQLHALRARLAR
jgi:hypothetical protein